MNSVDLLNTTWKHMTKKQKKEFLKARNLSLSWAETKTIKEMVKRGGGIIAKDLLHVVKEWKKRNPNAKIKWKVKK